MNKLRELGSLYATLYRGLDRWTLGLFGLAAGWKLFWLVPGVGLFDAARALRQGTDTPDRPGRELIAAWGFVALVVAYAAVRRWGMP
jgi:hypothetical protein